MSAKETYFDRRCSDNSDPSADHRKYRRRHGHDPRNGSQATKDAIGADLALGNVSATHKLQIGDVALSKEGEEVLSIKQLDVKPSLFALIGGRSISIPWL